MSEEITSPEDDLRVRFDADGGSLFVLYIKNIFFTVITLGVYYFWANVNLKRYFYEHTSVLGERFGYHATGKERFIGFLKGLLVIVVVAVIFIALQAGLGYLFGTTTAAIVTPILLYVLFFLVTPVLIVASTRYRMSRTSWREVRMRFTGRPKKLFFIYLKGILLSFLTLGFYYPWFYVSLQKFYASGMAYGSARFDYDGKGSELLKKFLLGTFLTIITFGIYYFFFIASIYRYDFNHTIFHGVRMQSNLSGSDFFVTTIVTNMMVGASLGIASPWAIVMMRKLMYESIAFTEKPDFESITTHEDESASAFADGLADAGDFFDSLADMIG